jgi:hypothetical protein
MTTNKLRLIKTFLTLPPTDPQRWPSDIGSPDVPRRQRDHRKNNFANLCKKFIVEEAQLYTVDGHKLVIATEQVDDVIGQLHVTKQHIGKRGLFKIVEKEYYWVCTYYASGTNLLTKMDGVYNTK